MTSYSIEQAEKLLLRSRRSIFNYIHSGELQTVSLGHSKRITEESLIDKMHEQGIYIDKDTMMKYIENRA